MGAQLARPHSRFAGVISSSPHLLLLLLSMLLHLHQLKLLHFGRARHLSTHNGVARVDKRMLEHFSLLLSSQGRRRYVRQLRILMLVRGRLSSLSSHGALRSAYVARRTHQEAVWQTRAQLAISRSRCLALAHPAQVS